MCSVLKWSSGFCFLCLYFCMEYVECGILPLTLLQKPPTNSDVRQSGQNSGGAISSTIAHRFAGYIEYQPNGTIILRSSSLENSTNVQNLILFKTILKAIKLAAPFAIVDTSSRPNGAKFNIKIYGEGIEHKFPPFLEDIIQRIQTYFSVYRHTDTGYPVRQDSTSTSTSTTTTTSNSDYDNLYGSLATTTNYVHGNTDVSGNLETTAFINDNDDYNEFISIGENDSYITIGED